MAFITVSNSKKIIQKVDEVHLDGIAEAIYKKDISFFSRRESANLKGIRELFRNLENFVAEYYRPIQVVDTYRYVFPEHQPAYHHDNSCERLKAKFLNYEVPDAIRQKGPDAVIEFRNWFHQTSFKDDSPSDYIMKLTLKYPEVGAIKPQSIEHKNSGIEIKKDYSLSELEKEIDNLLLEAEEFFHSSPVVRDILYRYQKLTFLCYTSGGFKFNNSGLPDEELKSFLLGYERKFKIPVKERLIEYYRIKFNPDMKFEGTLLDKLGFKPCGGCLK